jgi:prevent-host-death family protein
MTDVVPLNEAKTHLSELVRRVEAGEEIVIRRGRKRVARLVPDRPSAIRPPGALRGRVRMADDFDEPLAEFTHLLPGP